MRTARTNAKATVLDLAEKLQVKPGFLYLVEQGRRKPKDGAFGQWASVYGVNYADMWKCLHKIPMDLVGSLREERKPPDPFLTLTEHEKAELLPFLEYVRWKMANRSTRQKTGR